MFLLKLIPRLSLLPILLISCRPGHFEEQARSQVSKNYELSLEDSRLVLPQSSKKTVDLEFNIMIFDLLNQAPLANQSFKISVSKASERITPVVSTVFASSDGIIPIKLKTRRYPYQLSGKAAFELSIESKALGQLAASVEIDFSQTESPVLRISDPVNAQIKEHLFNRKIDLQLTGSQSIRQQPLRHGLVERLYLLEFLVLDHETRLAVSQSCFNWRLHSSQEKESGFKCTNDNGIFSVELRLRWDPSKHAVRYRVDLALNFEDGMYADPQSFSLIVEPGSSEFVSAMLSEDELQQNFKWKNTLVLFASQAVQGIQLRNPQLRSFSHGKTKLRILDPHSLVPTQATEIALEFRAAINRSGFTADQDSWMSLADLELEAELSHVQLNDEMTKINITYDRVDLVFPSDGGSRRGQRTTIESPVRSSSLDAFILSVRSPQLNRLGWSSFLFDRNGAFVGPFEIERQKTPETELKSWMLFKKDFERAKTLLAYEQILEELSKNSPSELEMKKVAFQVWETKQITAPMGKLYANVYSLTWIDSIDGSQEQSVKQALKNTSSMVELEIGFFARLRHCIGFRFSNIPNDEPVLFDSNLSVVCTEDKFEMPVSEYYFLSEGSNQSQKVVRGRRPELPDCRQLNSEFYHPGVIVRKLRTAVDLN